MSEEFDIRKYINQQINEELESKMKVMKNEITTYYEKILYILHEERQKNIASNEKNKQQIRKMKKNIKDLRLNVQKQKNKRSSFIESLIVSDLEELSNADDINDADSIRSEESEPNSTDLKDLASSDSVDRVWNASDGTFKPDDDSFACDSDETSSLENDQTEEDIKKEIKELNDENRKNNKKNEKIAKMEIDIEVSE